MVWLRPVHCNIISLLSLFLNINHLLVETGTILLDTVCLSEAAGKTTTKDISLVEKLEALVPHHSRQATYDTLLNARRQISGNLSLNAVYVDL